MTFLLFFNVLPVSGQNEQEGKKWVGKLKDGTTISKLELNKIINEHEKWSRTKGKEGIRANLSEAFLRGADLSEAFLRGANLSKADLSEAFLRGANLSKAVLSGADLSGADLRGADLRGADLSEADLWEADLSEADLWGADLSEAFLWEADLSEADLSEADLSKANLEYASLKKADLSEANLSEAEFWFSNVSEAIFEVKSKSLPYIPSIASAKGLSSLSYHRSVHALVELRKSFKEAGLRTQERAITYAIKSKARKDLWKGDSLNKVESIINLIFFEWTCAYGMLPGRCFLTLIVLIFLFTVPYTESLSREGEDGIWVVWITDRVRKDLGRKEPVRLKGLGWSTIKWGLYFSILSAFSIGWREINVGNWIARMQWREYTLRATGWVRFVSGIQSLTSVYLLALWVLTYFGRPFEAV